MALPKIVSPVYQLIFILTLSKEMHTKLCSQQPFIVVSGQICTLIAVNNILYLPLVLVNC